MATLNLNNLTSGQIDQLHQIATGSNLADFDCDGEIFSFPITHMYDVRQVIGHRPERIDISDDVIAANLRYRIGSDTVCIAYEINDLEIGEIVLNLTDQEMKELIADAGFAEIKDGRLVEYIQTGTDQYGEPIEEEHSPSVFEWCDTAPNVETFNLHALLVAYLMRKENRYYVAAKMQLAA